MTSVQTATEFVLDPILDDATEDFEVESGHLLLFDVIPIGQTFRCAVEHGAGLVAKVLDLAAEVPVSHVLGFVPDDGEGHAEVILVGHETYDAASDDADHQAKAEDRPSNGIVVAVRGTGE